MMLRPRDSLHQRLLQNLTMEWSSRPGVSARRRSDEFQKLLVLTSRYMLSDRQRENDCQAVDVSSTGVAVLGPVKGTIGERVVAFFDRIGRSRK
jgi:hypothetical protein